MKNIPDWKIEDFTEVFTKSIGVSLVTINNPQFTAMDVMRMIVTDKGYAQHVWGTIVESCRISALMQALLSENIAMGFVEILCFCVENGAQPSKRQLWWILSLTEAMTRVEQLTVAFLKTLIALHKNNHFTCHLQFLGDLHRVSQEILQLGRQLVHAVNGTIDKCLKSKQLIDCFLFISNEKGEILGEQFIEDSLCKNWLKRSPLHLAILFIDRANYFKCLPENVFTRYANDKDLHGCTPLHLAHLHHNEQAIQFLESHGAKKDVTDKFGMTPESLGSRVDVVWKDREPVTVCNNKNETREHPDVIHYKLCESVIGTKDGVLEKMRPMLIHSEFEAEALSNELKILFEHLVKCQKKSAEFAKAIIQIAGSFREKLKTGCLNEADIQLLFKGNISSDSAVFFDNAEWSNEKFLEEVSDCLINSLAEISWEGINLRLISVKGPWLFLREGNGSAGAMTVSVDVVPVIVSKEEKDPPISQKKLLRLQAEILEKGQEHQRMKYSPLETWRKDKMYFRDTYCAYEWDIIDSLPTSCRLAIVIAKALIQAFEVCGIQGESTKMPITSYMMKTALFYILANSCGEVKFNSSWYAGTKTRVLSNALEKVGGDKSKDQKKEKSSKLKYNPKPKWLTDEDVDQHGEEARVLAEKIFLLIKYLAEEGWKLRSFWDRDYPISDIGGFGGNPISEIRPHVYEKKLFGEADYILKTCNRALERFKKDTFYEKKSND